jgi:rare lipoprotein A (peptidoglycan hydrolase)
MLRRDTLGVANVKLRCGTPVELEFAGRAIVVPVIDRGPYVKGVKWDLTGATARALGVRETEAIGAAALPIP